METLHFLAIDPAAIRMGLARWRSSPEVSWSGFEDLGTSEDSVAYRLHAGRNLMRKKIIGFMERGEPINAIYVEDFDAEAWARGGVSNAHTRQFLTKIQGMIEEVAFATRTPLEFVSTDTWRKHFLGYSRVPKGQKVNWKKLAVEECRRRGWSVRDHNQAEAMAILDWARSKHDPDYSWRSTSLFAGRTA